MQPINLHFSRRFAPPPPNDSPKGEKSCNLSGISTLSANYLSWRRGGWQCPIVLDVRAFLAIRQFPGLAEGPSNHRCIVRADIVTDFNHAPISLRKKISA